MALLGTLQKCLNIQHSVFCVHCTGQLLKEISEFFIQNYAIAVKSYSKGFVKTINSSMSKKFFAKITKNKKIKINI